MVQIRPPSIKVLLAPFIRCASAAVELLSRRGRFSDGAEQMTLRDDIIIRIAAEEEEEKIAEEEK